MGALLSVQAPVITPTVHFAEKPALLSVQKNTETDGAEAELLSLRVLLETRCPSIFTEFKPLWWLFK
jgi:hypothetical protein